MTADEPKVGDHSPWGRIDNARRLADGIVCVGTASHGGIYLSPSLNVAMPDVFRCESGWYEEDCEWALVALIYPDAFSEKAQASAHETIKNWFPDAYETWSGVVLKPGESRQKDERSFLDEHAKDWIVISAFGSWHKSVPDGWVGVYAKPGEFLKANSANASTTRLFLVTTDEYETRKETLGMFVCDPLRHPAWDPDKPKDAQALGAASQPSDEDEESQYLRP